MPANPACIPSPRERAPVDEMLDVVGLTGERGSRVSRLSGGQQRRLDVAIALAGDPEMLFLDEPTTVSTPRPAATRGPVGLRQDAHAQGGLAAVLHFSRRTV